MCWTRHKNHYLITCESLIKWSSWAAQSASILASQTKKLSLKQVFKYVHLTKYIMKYLYLTKYIMKYLYLTKYIMKYLYLTYFMRHNLLGKFYEEHSSLNHSLSINKISSNLCLCQFIKQNTYRLSYKSKCCLKIHNETMLVELF